jgi:hypothetical protein
MIQLVTALTFGGIEAGAGKAAFPRKRARAADLPAAALVSAVADLLPRLRGVGAAGVPALARVAGMLVDDAGPVAGYVVD